MAWLKNVSFFTTKGLLAWEQAINDELFKRKNKRKVGRPHLRNKNNLYRGSQVMFSKNSPVYDKYKDSW